MKFVYGIIKEYGESRDIFPSVFEEKQDAINEAIRVAELEYPDDSEFQIEVDESYMMPRVIVRGRNWNFVQQYTLINFMFNPYILI